MAMNEIPPLPPIHLLAFQGQPDLAAPAVLRQVLRERIGALLSGEHRLLAFSSLTNSADIFFSQEALDLGVPLMLLLPIPAENLRGHFPAELQPQFDKIVARAIKVEVVSSTSSEWNASSLGQKLVDEAEVLLALWDGDENSAGNATAETVAYASYRGRPVIALRPAGGAIEVREIKPDSEISSPKISVEALQKKLGELPPAPVIPEELLRYFKACDEAATQTAPEVRRHYLNIVVANALASVAGSIDSSFPQTALTGALLNITKFGCVLLGLGIFLMLRHRQSQNHWLGLRLRAELCRSAIATWLSPSTVKPIPADHVPELRGLIQALRYFHVVHRGSAAVSLEQFKADYATRRLVDQLNYFRAQADDASHLDTWLTPSYWVFSCVALGTAAGSFLFQTVFGHAFVPGTWANFGFNFVPAIAPALASWILAFQAIRSVGRRRARFREMERLMHQALIELVHSHTEEEVHHLVKRSEKLLLNEVLEWYSFVKYGR
jgi:hypothetical protein